MSVPPIQTEQITTTLEEIKQEEISQSERIIPFQKWTRLLVVVSTLLALSGVLFVLGRVMVSIHHTLLLFALGALVAYALDPLVEWLRHPLPRQEGVESKGLPRKASVAIVFCSLLLLVGLGIWWLGGQAVHQATTLQQDFPAYQKRALTLATDIDAKLSASHIPYNLEDTLSNPPPELKATVERIGKQILPFVENGVKVVSEGVIVLLIALYFLIFSAEMKERINKKLPPSLLRYAIPWEEDINRILGGFVRGQVTIALIMGVAAAFGCFAIGIHIWLIIGLFVVIASLIPVFGPYIGAVPAIVAALVGPTHLPSPIVAAIVILVWFVVINEVGSKVLYPTLVGAALGLHEVLVLFVIFAGLEINGIVGTLFAAPATALAIVTIVHLYRLWYELPDVPLSETIRVRRPPRSVPPSASSPS